MRTERAFIRNEKGLSLVEVLAAVVILGVVVTAFISLSNYTLFSQQKTTRADAALREAEHQLQQARAAISANGQLPTAPFTPPLEEGFTITFQESALTAAGSYTTGSFGRQHVSVQAVILVGGSPRLLTVTASWEEG